MCWSNTFSLYLFVFLTNFFVCVSRAAEISLTIDKKVLRKLDKQKFLNVNFDTNLLRGNWLGIDWR